MTGAELLQAIIDERAAPPTGITTLNLAGTHRWLTSIAPGRAVFAWPVGSSHHNLEGNVLCSWTMAVADQAMFLAGCGLMGEGETTRMQHFSFSSVQEFGSGVVTVEAIVTREGAIAHGRCVFTDERGEHLASVLATFAVIH